MNTDTVLWKMAYKGLVHFVSSLSLVETQFSMMHMCPIYLVQDNIVCLAGQFQIVSHAHFSLHVFSIASSHIAANFVNGLLKCDMYT